MLAAIPAAWVTTKKGRKVSMLVASSCYIVGIIIVTAAVHIAMLIIGRILLGVGVGFAIQVGACSG
jgi:predicted MFS family arabinose efflux permease